MTSNTDEYYIGVDVGTSSARAALVNQNGSVIKVAVQPIKIWNPQSDFFQQSSDDIWSSCCKVIKEVTKSVEKDLVKGIGFDATCSLVAIDENGNPVSVSPAGELEQNIILWLDHRAEHEANEINELGHSLLQYVGGKLSLEMELPKLLWLKRHLKQQCWNETYYFFDLADFLTWKATGCDSRSSCTVICKWLYDAVACQWDKKFFNRIGLEDLLVDDCSKIGKVIQAPGTPCGNGITENAANQMNLLPGTFVATSIIDAHAGVLGLIGATNNNLPIELDTRLSLICGTSTCHMSLSNDALFVPGVWGPYFSVLGMGFWLNEGGQSATGKLLDHIIDIHPASVEIRRTLPKGMHIVEYLNNLIMKLSEKRELSSYDLLTRNIHVRPDFHGNRSPLADPTLRGMICGLTLSAGEEDLALVYLATVQALAYGTKNIIMSLEKAGHKGINSVLICGGLGQNKLFVQTHADVMGCTVLIPKEEQSVLLGSAMLAATASGRFNSVQQAVCDMACHALVVEPNNKVLQYHKKKYDVFLRMVDDQKMYKKIMEASSS